MESKTMNVDFYRVEMPAEPESPFEDCFKAVQDLPDDDSRTYEINGSPIRMQAYTKYRDIYKGEVIRIRMDDLPVKARLSGETEPLDLDDDQGLGEETAFLYNSTLKVLLLQRNRVGVTASRFIRYFTEMNDIDENIDLQPILQTNALRQLQQMHEVRRLELRFAGLDNMEVFQDLGYGVSGIVELSEQFDAPSISLSIGMGHKKGSLMRDNVIDAVKKVLALPTGLFSNRVDKIRVVGKDDLEGESKILDMLKYRMIESKDVPVSLDGRLLFANRLEALNRAWRTRKQELETLFKPKLKIRRRRK